MTPPPQLPLKFVVTRQADELEDAFAELILEYKHEKASSNTSGTAIEIPTNTNANRLLLPVNRLAAWTPVRKMVETHAATDEDVDVALAKAQKASSRGGGGEDEQQRDGGGVDFVGFLEFIHSLDVEVNPLLKLLMGLLPTVECLRGSLECGSREERNRPAFDTHSMCVRLCGIASAPNGLVSLPDLQRQA